MYRAFLFLLINLIVFSCTPKKEKETSEIVLEITDPKATEVWQTVPTVLPATETKIPSDAIVLFDGENFDKWINSKDSTAVKWALNQDKSMSVIPNGYGNSIQTKQNFGNIQLHLEWKSPEKIEHQGQHRGNSGVFLQNRYEIQILDNNNNETYANGQVGAIYKQSVPLAKASVPTGEWNTYDIIYHAPIFNNKGEKTKAATITVLHNGILIQDHFEIQGTTEYIGKPKNKAHGKAPIFLQDHNCAVSFRNIWVRELKN